MNRLVILTNLVFFQVVWFAAVVGAANQTIWIAILAFAGMVAIHLVTARSRMREMWLISTIAVIGFAVDTLLMRASMVSYNTAVPLPDYAPVWIVLLWAAFAATLNVSLRWMKPRLILAATSAAILGPVAYYGADKLGAVNLQQDVISLIAIGLIWALVTPLALVLAHRLDGFQPLKTQESLS
jgi:hypothetical protein